MFIYLLLLLIIRHFISSIRHFVGSIRHFISTIRHFVGSIRHFINTINAISSLCSNLTSIDIDTQINFATNKLWLPQSGSFYFFNNPWNTTAPMFNQIHIGKRMCKCFISDFGITFFHTLQSLSHRQFSR